MIINHNIPALNAYFTLTWNNSQVSKNLEKLSSGLRINRAADDAAGLVISEKMRAQIKGLDQATRNAQDGISMIQTAEGALSETHSILQRMRELSVQAANDTYTSNDRVAIQQEIDQLKDEVNRIANTTEFNTKKLLDGSTSALVSSDKLTTKIFMRDGLRVIDQFGQKAAGGGNYKLAITAEAGAAQVQKTDLMRVKHAGANEVTASNLGYARVDAGVGGTLDATTALNLSFKIDGVEYTIDNAGLAGTTAAGISLGVANAINNDVRLNSTLRATVNGNGFIVERIDAADKSFEMKAAAVGTAVTLSGDLAIGANYATADPKAQNVTAMTLDGSTMVAGDYSVGIDTAATAVTATSTISAQYVQKTGVSSILASIDEISATAGASNQSVSLEVVSIDGANVSFAYKFVQALSTTPGTIATGGGTFTVNVGTPAVSTLIGTETYNLTFSGTIGDYTVGDKVVINTQAAMAGGDDEVLSLTQVTSAGATPQTLKFSYDGATLSGATEVRFFQLDMDPNSANYGKVSEADVKLTLVLNGSLKDTETVAGLKKAAEFTVAAGSTVGSLARMSTKLYDIEKFWDASGNFILENPQTLTLIQGNGSESKITLFGSDTIQDVVDKLNKAIGVDLGQNELDDIGLDTDKYATFVTTAASSGLEAVAGTFVIRSAMTGRSGAINFVGDDNVLAALSLTTIQNTSENKFTVDVTEAHKGTVIASGYKLEGNNLIGVVHANVDVQFDANTGIKAAWNTATKTFDFSSVASGATTFIHIADRSTVLQVGANPLQDLSASVGNMTAAALGIDNLQVTSNPLANNAIRTIDKAIGLVSGERAKLGAVQNRLDHTINSLGASYENLVAAESRIRDVDMAKQMMEFTKYNILSQAATAMMAQANQLPQSVLQLLR